MPDLVQAVKGPNSLRGRGSLLGLKNDKVPLPTTGVVGRLRECGNRQLVRIECVNPNDEKKDDANSESESEGN